MKRVSELVGKPIVASDTGDKMGNVSDLLLSRRGDCLVGLIVSGGLLARERVLPFDGVQTLGKDAIVARERDRLLDARAWQQRGVDASRSSALRRKRVVTTEGRDVGTVSDLQIDEVTGAVDGYEVNRPSFAGLLSKRLLLPRSDATVIGADAIVVPAALIDAARG